MPEKSQRDDVGRDDNASSCCISDPLDHAHLQGMAPFEDRFVCDLAHDIANMLTVIGGCAELLLADDRMPIQHQRRILQIVKAVERSTHAIRRLFAFSSR